MVLRGGSQASSDQQSGTTEFKDGCFGPGPPRSLSQAQRVSLLCFAQMWSLSQLRSSALGAGKQPQRTVLKQANAVAFQPKSATPASAHLVIPKVRP